MPFKVLGLSDPLVQGILATGYTAPTEIQSQAIPAAIENKDIIASAQTGTGKTAAFVLPILNRLSHEKHKPNKQIKALILTPTRELALQIESCIKDYGRFLKLRTLTVYGGVSINNQLKVLKKGVEIVVATPGRLLDHITRKSIDLRHIEVLVLDEADRMLDMGFIKDVRKIVGGLPTNRQTLLFSATLPTEVKALAQNIQKSPVNITIGVQNNPIDTITQHIFNVNKNQKCDLLLYMLKNQQMHSVLVFSRTKHGADKIARILKKHKISVVSIHSGRTQAQRQDALQGFKAGKFQVMVATDIAARGIDIDDITHVINYDVPTYAEDYIHRIGRTGRAKAVGDAITFVSYDEEVYLKRIERFIGSKFEMKKFEGFEYAPSDKPLFDPKAFASSQRTAAAARQRALGGASRRRRRTRR